VLALPTIMVMMDQVILPAVVQSKNSYQKVLCVQNWKINLLSEIFFV
jgi:hypothetical protein